MIHNSRHTPYPKNVICDFRKLGKESLLKIIKHYTKDNKYITPDISRIDLAATVAHVFDLHQPMELDILDHFASQHCLSTMDVNIRSSGNSGASGSNKHNNSSNGKTATQIDTNFERLKLDGEPARVGEQVAAQASSDGDADAWILVNVLAYDPQYNTYLVQDEDDCSNSNESSKKGNSNNNNSNQAAESPPSSAITVSAATQVKRLHDSAAHLRKGDAVFAVFPDTTSFYRGTVVRNPRPPGDSAVSSTGGSTGSKNKDSGWDVVVRFDDDEDESGRSPPRRIPARFVLLISDAQTPNLIQGAQQQQQQLLQQQQQQYEQQLQYQQQLQQQQAVGVARPNNTNNTNNNIINNNNNNNNSNSTNRANKKRSSAQMSAADQ